jgi:hypothetical protein
MSKVRLPDLRKPGCGPNFPGQPRAAGRRMRVNVAVAADRSLEASMARRAECRRPAAVRFKAGLQAPC